MKSMRYHSIYRWYDVRGVLLYVGVTHQPTVREKGHRANSWWIRWADRCVVDPPLLTTRAEAEQAESAAIASESPAFNKTHQAAFDAAAKYLTEIGLDPWDFADRFPPIGRPKSEDPRGNGIGIRFTATEHAIVKAAADAAGQSLSTWVRERAVASAKRAQAKPSS
jgi:hypothetical protein